MRLQTQVAPEIQKRLLLSRVEAESLKERDILCPTCGFRIVNDPSVILADEPMGALDSKTTEEIMSVFEKLNESGKTIIIVIHDKDIAAKCRRVIEIADGRIVSDSKSK